MWLHGRSEQCVSPPQYCVSTQTQQEEGIISYNYAQKRKQNEQTEVTSSSPVLLIRTGKKYWREFLSLLFNKGLKYNVAVLVWVAFASLRFLLLHLL